MPLSFRCFITGLAFLLLGSPTQVAGAPPSRTVPLSPDAWTATDSIRFRALPGPPRPLHQPGCGPGARGGDGERHAGARRGRQRHHELPGRGVPGGRATVLQRRVPAAGSQRYGGSRAVRTGVQQRGRRLAGVPWRWRQRGRRAARAIAGCMSGSSWTGPDGAAVSWIPRRRRRSSCRGWWRRAAAGLGVWAGAFGRGAYFSNIRYTAAPAILSAAPPEPTPPAGTMLGLGDLQPDRGRRLHARQPFPISAGSPGSRSKRSPKGSS